MKDISWSIEEENTQVLNLIQAMIGAVSPNLRRVTLEVLKPLDIRIWFLLEQDLADDREEIDDIGFEFEALQESGIKLDIEIIVDNRPISHLKIPGRTVFGRKE